MHIRDVVKHTLADFEAGNTVIWLGPPGYGKTQVSLALYERMVANNPTQRIGLCRVFMATQQDVDATGLPWKGEVTYSGKTFTITEPAMPRWYISHEGLPACVYDKVLLIVEEWGQGNAEAKRAFASVVLEHGVPGFYLPNGSHVLMLSNVDANDGVTKEFDFIITRRHEYTIVGDEKVWDEDFASKPYMYDGRVWQVSDLLRAWARQRPSHFFAPKPKKQGQYCNPRTACAWDRYTQSMIKAGTALPKLITEPDYIESSGGQIGMDATQSLMEFANFKIALPPYEDVVKDPDNTPVPNNADQRCLMAYGLAGNADVNDLDALFRYMKRMQADLQVTFAQSLIGRDYKTFMHAPAFTAFVSKNAALLTALQAATA